MILSCNSATVPETIFIRKPSHKSESNSQLEPLAEVKFAASSGNIEAPMPGSLTSTSHHCVAGGSTADLQVLQEGFLTTTIQHDHLPHYSLAAPVFESVVPPLPAPSPNLYILV
jgi:hypothetical protein